MSMRYDLWGVFLRLRAEFSLLFVRLRRLPPASLSLSFHLFVAMRHGRRRPLYSLLRLYTMGVWGSACAGSALIRGGGVRGYGHLFVVVSKKRGEKVLQDGAYVQFFRPKGPLEQNLRNQLRA
ncbi:hypothetical protein B0H14DRAFT_3499162 [Mycena olivaceomarginata]|nr:hypothetical protein B0H14DRAFT_3499162 [Mycena olivaceomarginata]